MIKRLSLSIVVPLAASVGLLAGCASSGPMTSAEKSQQLDEQHTLATNAGAALDLQSQRPYEQRIPRALIRNARCIGVFPGVTQAGLVVGGTHGHGLVSCRDRSGDFAKAPPASFDLTSGSLGLQAGGQKANVVVLFQTDAAVSALMNGKVGLGTQVAATAGPSGWDRAAGDAANAPVVVYSQSTGGLYAGLNVRGGKLSFNSRANQALYGASASPRGILLGDRNVPGSVLPFNDALRRWATSASNDAGSS